MCPGPRKPPAMATPTPTPMPMPKQEPASSSLLELAADDNLAAFRRAVQEDTLSLVAASAWYGPSAKGPSRLALELRTPAMVAALYGSTAVLSYVLSIAPSEAARASATDGATPLYLAAAGGAASSIAATHLLLAAGESPDAHAASGLRAGDLLPRSTPADEPIRLLLKSPAASPSSSPTHKKDKEREKQDMKKEHGHPELPDLNSGVFCTDEFRMYSFKVKPCSRAYTHDWTECPFAHPGENARRRDPRRFSYSCVPCPDFRKSPASCRKGDACEYAHGVFESWLHPAQYRTRLCKDEVGCPRRICFFAHRPEELRAVNPSAVSVAMPSPHSSSLPPNLPSGLDMARVAMLTGASRPVLKAPLSSRELDFDLDQYKHKLLLGSSAAAASPLAPRTAPDYSDLLGSVSQLQAPALRQGGDINMPAYGCLPEAQMHSAHRPPPGRPMVGGHSMAKAIMSSRASAFAKRSQSFVDRAPAARSFVSPPATTSALSDWGSPDGRLDWSVQGAELRKSASFGIRSAQTTNYATPDVSWVNSLVKDGSDILAAHWSDLEQMVA